MNSQTSQKSAPGGIRKAVEAIPAVPNANRVRGERLFSGVDRRDEEDLTRRASASEAMPEEMPANTGIPRSVSGPINVGRSRVAQMVDNLEAASASSSRGSLAGDSSNKVRPNGSSGPSAGFARPRSKSHTNPGDAKVQAGPGHHGTSRPPEMPSSSQSRLMPPSSSSLVSGQQQAESQPLQAKPSLRTRLFGFKSSKLPSPSPVLVSPREYLPPDSPASPAVSSPTAPRTPQSNTHSSDAGDSRSLAPSMTEDHAARESPRRSVSTSSSSGRNVSRSTDTGSKSIPSSESSFFRKARAMREKKTMTLRQKASIASLEKASREPSPTPPDQPEDQSGRGNSNTTYKQRSGRRGDAYNMPDDIPSTLDSQQSLQNDDLNAPKRRPPPLELVEQNDPDQGRRPSATQESDGSFLLSLGETPTYSTFPAQVGDYMHTMPPEAQDSTPKMDRQTGRLESPIGASERLPPAIPELEPASAGLGFSPSVLARAFEGTSTAPTFGDSHGRQLSTTSGMALAAVTEAGHGDHLSRRSSIDSFAERFMRRRASRESLAESTHRSGRSNPPYLPRSSSLHGHGSSVENSPLQRSSSAIVSNKAKADSGRESPASFQSHINRPSIQPRTTSSPLSRSRPSSSHDSPSSGAGQFRSQMRITRPRTSGESGHRYSGSVSSNMDLPLQQSSIKEEASPDGSKGSIGGPNARTPTIPGNLARMPSAGEVARPGLPPKNPLRGQATSSSNKGGAEDGSTPIVGRTGATSSSSGPSTPAIPGPASPSQHAAAHSQMYVSPWLDSPAPSTPGDHASGQMVYESGGSQKPPPLPTKEPSSTAMGLRPGATLQRSLSTSTIQDSDGPTPWVDQERKMLREGFQPTLSPTSSATRMGDSQALLPVLTPSSSKKVGKLTLANAFKGGRSRSRTIDTGDGADGDNSEKAKKKDGASGSKLWAFGRSEAENEGASPFGSVRKGSKTIKGRKSEISRPQIRRVFDTPEDDGSRLGVGDDLMRRERASSVPETAKLVRDASLSESRETVPGLPASSSANILGSVNGASPIQAGTIPPTPYSPKTRVPSTGVERSPGFSSQGWAISTDSLSADARRLVKRWYVLRELLETERSYASDLAVARDVYLARARMKAGVVSPAASLQTSSSGFFPSMASSTSSRVSTPSQSNRIPSSLGHGPPPIGAQAGLSSRQSIRNPSTDSNPHALGSTSTSLNPTSPASFTSSNPSNRSSMYTISSQSSQTSEGAGFSLPPIPPGLSGLSPASPGPNGLLGTGPTSVGNTVGSSVKTVASKSSASLSSTPAASTTSLPLSSTPIAPIGTHLLNGGSGSVGPATPDAPFSPADIRIVFAQLEQCATLADEITATLEASVGTSCLASSDEVNDLLLRSEVREEDESDRVGRAFLKLVRTIIPSVTWHVEPT